MENHTEHSESQENTYINPSANLGTIADYIQILDNFSHATVNYVAGHVKNIMSYFKATLVSLSAYLLFVLLPRFSYPLHCVLAFAVWIAFYLVKLARLFAHYSESTSRERRFHLAKSMVSSVLIVLSLVFMELKCFRVSFCSAYVITSPLLVSLLLSLVLFRDARNHCLGIAVALKNLVSFFRLVLVFMILIRIERTITDRWFLTLWYFRSNICRITWLCIFLLIIALITFTIYYMLILKESDEGRSENWSTAL
eukprot:TRINITY_DN9634_c0_g2_i15.p1 TRINITY_DN9634_c0_g2~~TRINITY_DN9634_c0_g2_i15.p1  ORF type:complete len:254 (-),score=32.40 TRINITY_DN9634_c0_g2_i15:653-1414(-)